MWYLRCFCIVGRRYVPDAYEDASHKPVGKHTPRLDYGLLPQFRQIDDLLVFNWFGTSVRHQLEMGVEIQNLILDPVGKAHQFTGDLYRQRPVSNQSRRKDSMQIQHSQAQRIDALMRHDKALHQIESRRTGTSLCCQRIRQEADRLEFIELDPTQLLRQHEEVKLRFLFSGKSGCHHDGLLQ